MIDHGELIDVEGNGVDCSIHGCEYLAVVVYDDDAYCQRHYDEAEEEALADMQVDRMLEDRWNEAVINAYQG